MVDPSLSIHYTLYTHKKVTSLWSLHNTPPSLCATCSKSLLFPREMTSFVNAPLLNMGITCLFNVKWKILKGVGDKQKVDVLVRWNILHFTIVVTKYAPYCVFISIFCPPMYFIWNIAKGGRDLEKRNRHVIPSEYNTINNYLKCFW